MKTFVANANRGIIGGRLARPAPLLAVLAALLVAGCSTMKLAYEQAPRLAYWWIDPYVDFDDTQERRAKQDISHWFAWHRTTQLPHYAQALARAQREAAQDATPAQACQWWQQVQQWRDTAFEQAVPMAVNLALSIKPEQIDHLQRHYAKTNKKFRNDYLQDDPDVRRREAVKRVVERAERVYGRLDDTQRQWIAQKVAASPFDAQLWSQERQRRQQDIVQTLRSLQAGHATREQAHEAVRGIYRRVVDSPNETYRAYARTLTAYNCEFVAQLHNRTTPEQREVAAERLQGWETDFRALADTGMRVGSSNTPGDLEPVVSALER